jgi:ribosome maturation protein Sdo1
LLLVLAGKIGLLPDPIIGSNAQPQNLHLGKSTESLAEILSKVAHNGNIQFSRAGTRRALLN